VTLHQKPNTLQTDSFWMPFTANRQFKKAPAAVRFRRGHALLPTVDGPQGDRRLGRPLVRQCRPWPPPDRKTAVERQLTNLDFAPLVQHGSSAGVRFCRAARRDRAEGDRSHLLHQLGFGVGPTPR